MKGHWIVWSIFLIILSRCSPALSWLRTQTACFIEPVSSTVNPIKCWTFLFWALMCSAPLFDSRSLQFSSHIQVHKHLIIHNIKGLEQDPNNLMGHPKYSYLCTQPALWPDTSNPTTNLMWTLFAAETSSTTPKSSLCPKMNCYFNYGFTFMCLSKFRVSSPGRILDAALILQELPGRPELFLPNLSAIYYLTELQG